MAEIASRMAQLRAQKGFRAEAAALYKGAAEEVGAIVRGAATGDDLTVPPDAERGVLAEAGAVIDGLFVGADGRNAFAEDGVTALSPYALAVNRWTSWATLAIVRGHERFIRGKVDEDVAAWLGRGRFLSAEELAEGHGGNGRVVAEQFEGEEAIRAALGRALDNDPALRERVAEAVFQPNALAEYKAAHTWIDPNGHRLSDRVWQNGQRTRAKLDGLLADGIREGRSAVQLSRQVEQFLVPGREKLRTRKPFGTDGSADGMRLARTEITRAAGQATIVASRMNPYADKIAWRLSGSHPKVDICDVRAEEGPYAVDNVPVFPAHPHDLCSLITLVVQAQAAVTEALREAFEAAVPAGIEPVVSPADAERFAEGLMGRTMVELAKAVERELAA